jgi:hypothetical protein
MHPKYQNDPFEVCIDTQMNRLLGEKGTLALRYLIVCLLYFFLWTVLLRFVVQCDGEHRTKTGKSTRRKKDRVVGGRVVPDVRDTCVLM